MSFIVRQSKRDDLNQIYDLAKQFSLLNLPPNKKLIGEKIEISIDSFSDKLKKERSSFLFVVEDIENQRIAGCSQIKTKHGTVDEPTYSFKVLKKERFSKDLGLGFIHQILRLQINTDGPTEIGGLVVDKNYRRRPEKVGKLISLSRFLYIGISSDNFEPTLLAEMAPPLTEEGRSDFWEALGRRFTGLPYQEADKISQQNKEFIRSLFPEEDIYLCLLDSQARLILGRVSHETQPALHLLNSIGFHYKHEVDPFDGGPHLNAKTKDITLINQSQWLNVTDKKVNTFNQEALIGLCRDNEFICTKSALYNEGKEIVLPEKTVRDMQLSPGEKVFTYLI